MRVQEFGAYKIWISPMTTRTTLTVQLKPEVKEQLERLSETTSRTRSYLAAEAIAAYVARETDIVEGIHRGLAVMKAGRLVPQDEAMAEIDAAIEMVARGHE